MAEKLKQEGRAELSQAELTEELEDEEGNVYNRKVRSSPALCLRCRKLNEPVPDADVRGPQAAGFGVDAFRVTGQCCSLTLPAAKEKGAARTCVLGRFAQLAESIT